jgi:hypothetical protein
MLKSAEMSSLALWTCKEQDGVSHVMEPSTANACLDHDFTILHAAAQCVRSRNSAVVRNGRTAKHERGHFGSASAATDGGHWGLFWGLSLSGAGKRATSYPSWRSTTAIEEWSRRAIDWLHWRNAGAGPITPCSPSVNGEAQSTCLSGISARLICGGSRVRRMDKGTYLFHVMPLSIRTPV